MSNAPLAPLTLALSKGRIFEETMPLLAEAGIEVPENPESSRKLILPTSDPGLRLIIVREMCIRDRRPVGPGDPRAPAVSAITYAGVGAGIALTGLACLALMASGAGANANWTALGGLTLALSALAWPGLNRPAPAHHLAAAPAPGRLPPGIGRLALHYGVFGAGYIIPATRCV